MFCEGFDISLAVQTMRTICFESNTAEDCQNLVWGPMRFWVEQLAKENPREIVCFHSPFMYDEIANGHSCTAYLVGPRKKILHLGDVCNRNKALAYFQWLQRILFESAEDIRRAGPFKVFRWWGKCHIPVDALAPDRETVALGIQKYFQTYAPPLLRAQITWLPDKTRSELTQQILIAAHKTARSQTHEERVDIGSKNF